MDVVTCFDLVLEGTWPLFAPAPSLLIGGGVKTGACPSITNGNEVWLSMWKCSAERGIMLHRDMHHSISKKAQEFKGLKRPYIPYNSFKLLKCIVGIVWNYNGPLFNLNVI